MILNSSSLIRNRQKDKFFGIDYYANLCHGSNDIYNYLSTPLDFFPLANGKEPSKSKNREEDFIKQIKLYDEPKIFGFFQNPDIYSCHESIEYLITHMEETKHGLFIETNSMNLLRDLDILEKFSKNHPLLIGIPIASVTKIDLTFFDDSHHFKAIEKLIKALSKTSIKFGVIIKPVIPHINDDVDEFKSLLDHLIGFEPSFIYPTFSLNFDSKKLNNFYTVIDKEKSNLKSIYFDLYGYKKSWQSPNITDLKRQFIFNIKKTKIAYSMNQIIDLYKKSGHQEQISLF
ncbi:MAG: radical SAM protein [Tenericutes bacterium]|jgi:DNA repair photolyase|nr:radical SAM protein [Mycoplasmatota bacterium]